MANIIINRKVLEQLVGKKLTLDQLKERISMMDAVLEKVNGDEMEVEVFPSRPDMLSEQGFARALSSFIGVKTGLRTYPVKKSGQKIIIDASVKEVRPFTACAIVKGIKFDDDKIKEIIQLQEKLHTTYGRNRKKAAIGVYPLEKITFPVTFKAEKPDKLSFIPLETDEAMTGLQILSRHKAGREYGALLEGKTKFPIFIDAKNEILSMPPIINSQLTGRITEKTKDVFIECSGFNYDALSICLNIIVTSLAEMGGEVYSLELVYPKCEVVFGITRQSRVYPEDKKTSPELSPRKMKFDLAYVNKRLGLSLKEKEAITCLEKMGFGYEKGMVLIPPYRADIMHQVDLVEDIAIGYGYENFTEELPNVSTIGEEAPLEKFSRKIREILVGLELMEVKNIHLLTELELNKRMGLVAKLITLKNALGENNTLRNSLLPSLLKNLQENQHNIYPQNIFEIGRIFEWAEEAETGVGEKDNLGIAICHDTADFTQVRQVLDALIRSLGLEAAIRDTKHASFIPGRVGTIVVEGKKLGIIGEVHPQMLTNWGITLPVVVLEVELEGLWGVAGEK